MPSPARGLPPLLFLLVLLMPACVAPEGTHATESTPPQAPAPEPSLATLAEEDWNTATSEDGRIAIAWRPTSGEIPRNEDFELDVVLFQDGARRGGAGIHLRGWMPDHGHGQVRQAVVTELGGGRYRVEGVLLHMRGDWVLSFDVTEGTTKTTLGFPIRLP